MIRLAPSLLSADFARLASEIAEVESAGADLLHLDLMDGCFVPNLTFGPQLVADIGRTTELPLDAHLMVADPDALVDDLVEAGVARIAIHPEAVIHLDRSLRRIVACGVAAGVALNPSTPPAVLEEVTDVLDFVVVMSVNPGFGGQSFLAKAIGKIKRIRAILGEDVDITVDGGVDLGNAEALRSAGATTLVAGSSIFGREDRRTAVQALREAAMKESK